MCAAKGGVSSFFLSWAGGGYAALRKGVFLMIDKLNHACSS